MALNLVKARFLTRTAGNCTIDHAAYIDRTKYRNEKTQELTQNYAKHGLVEWKEVWLPEGAPERWRNAQVLWNELEKREDENRKRDTALLSRSWIMTIPKELETPEQRLHMVKDMLREFTRQGWVCQAAVHAPDKENDNFHLHIQSPMRFVNEEGFGKRREATSDGRFATKQDELKHWKERWSEIGARHLERAGHTLEADRYREGHGNREQKLNSALDRNDKARADELENRPHIHLGPGLYQKDQRGEYTRNGAKNREIDEYNKARQAEREIARSQGRDAPNDLRGVNREIWWAYNGTRDAFGLRDSIEQRGMYLARISREDARESQERRQDAFRRDKTAPIYREGEYVVVNNRGYVYRLTPTSTGDQFWDIKKEMATLDNEPMLSLDQAKRYMMYRTDHDAQPIAYPERKEHVGSTREHIAYAFKNNLDPHDLRADLEQRGLRVARVTTEDHEFSKNQKFVAQLQNEKYPHLKSKYSPEFKEGEYVVVDQWNHTHRLGPRTTGHGMARVQEFMKPLDKENIPSLREVRSAIEAERLDVRNIRPYSSRVRIGPGKETAIGTLSRAAERTASAMIVGAGLTAANAVSGLLGHREMTPAERFDAEMQEGMKKTAREREAAHEQERQRGGGRER